MIFFGVVASAIVLYNIQTLFRAPEKACIARIVRQIEDFQPKDLGPALQAALKGLDEDSDQSKLTAR